MSNSPFAQLQGTNENEDERLYSKSSKVNYHFKLIETVNNLISHL